MGFGSIDRGDVGPRESQTEACLATGLRAITISQRSFSTTTCDGATGDALMRIAQKELEKDPYSGHSFVFVSRRCDRVKILTWDKGGFLLLYERLERGQFKLRNMDHTSVGSTFSDLASRDMLPPACGLGCRQPTGRRTGSISAMNGSRVAR
jgi:hypothetical protein